MNKERSPFSYSKLTRTILSRFFRILALYSGGLALTVGLAAAACHQVIWYSDDSLYQILKFIKEYLVYFLVYFWLTGFVCIFVFFWNKTLGYIDVLMQAGKELVAEDDELINLPPELKQVEEQMNQLKQKAAKNARLAKESEQRKNDLIVYLAHDLKTPLTSVIGYLTLLRDEPQISEGQREKYLSVSLDRAERLEELINEFFEITRFNLSSLTLDLSRVNMTRMIEQISYEFEPLYQEKELTCKLNLDPDLEIKCDVNKIERVFDNLIRNAVNYSFEGGTIEIVAKKQSEGLKIIFRNQGNTIPKEKLSRIFEQFFRLDSARTSRTGGAGLGLAIAKEIIELHKGSITAYSENEIVEFCIDLPCRVLSSNDFG